ncbi:MAG: RNAse (barnase) inhibitor barstar [Candidatus Nanohaloarchaea archaeon]|jgi:RNAse (barnase) inhibitor barstar
MSFREIVERAREQQLDEDNGALEDNESKIGEGANTSAHISSRGYVVKPVAYEPDSDSENPFEQAEVVEDIDRFPWVEVDERDVDGPFNYALVKMSRNDLTHSEAVESFHMSDVITEDLDMFFDLREDGFTYNDFKPDNIGYFWESGEPKARPIDVIDSHAWEQEEDLLYRRFSDILDVYIRGTPKEDGLVDLYPTSVPEAEEHVMEYLGMDTENITGDPYKDLFQAMEESQGELEDVLAY